MNRADFSALTPYSNHFEASKREILHYWMSQPSAYGTLEHYNIAPEFFGRYFGKRIIDYSFGVISGENELGNCPFIGVMVIFFKKKNFALDDVFVLCAELKNSFLYYSLKQDVLTHKVMQEIAHLMDQNLRGVIRDFTEATPLSHPETMSCSIVYDPEAHKKTAVRTISAYQYLQEIDIDFELLDELNDIESEALASMNLDAVMGHEAYSEVISLLSNYVKVLNWLIEFKEITYALNVLIDILEHTPIENMDEGYLEISTIYTKAIISDLSMWRTSVFVNQSAEDVHYLDDTLLSSIAQLQITLSEQDNHDTCDIEFF